jgi:hypothetical protein
MVQKFARLSRCFPIIKVQHATEAHSAANRPIGSSRGSGKLEQAILDTLVIALAMVMRQVFVYGTAQRCLPDEEHSIQTFFLDPAYEALRVRILTSQQLPPVLALKRV